mgnify:FL=1
MWVATRHRGGLFPDIGPIRVHEICARSFQPDADMGKFEVMSLLRFLARSLFASAFVADGVRKVTSPAELAPEAEAFTARVTPLVQRVVPSGYSSHVPDRAESWVRICGAAEVLGGVMFATGIGRRLGACLLAQASILNIAVALPEKGADAEEKQERRPEVLKNVALLGASVLATQDLQGRPSASWRRRNTSRKLRRAKARVAKKARQAVAS